MKREKRHWLEMTALLLTAVISSKAGSRNSSDLEGRIGSSAGWQQLGK